MSLIAFASAKGSPGVTQTVTALAASWPTDPVVADLDPVGGDVALRSTAPDGTPLETERGLLSYAVALRGGRDAALDDHLQLLDDGTPVLAGVRSPAQVQGLGMAWPSVARGLAADPRDVLADCGRIVPGTPVGPVIEAADALVLVARSEVESLAHLRERLLGLREPLRISSIGSVGVGVVLVGDPGDRRSREDLERLLASAGVPVPVFGTVAYDPKAVRALRTASPRAQRRSLLFRSLVDVTSRIRELAGARAGGYDERQVV
ncbi:hypothetical protein CLV56_3067 [Mumia flava]|uniref:MinD-like ATPase involved in chromosome partitioning or flagellar assembly n=1 Tax=Mumia flava TaxID=1348852 RepID=A0A2M9B6L2_9ACTN|nr:hypothetical protein [Mumia flava]PJJ53577.1 hypothetical protein CLV56_3067 [Mumia flava]